LVKVISRSIGDPGAISSDGADVWVANQTGDTVTEVSAATGRVTKVISTGISTPDGISSDGTHVWVANKISARITELSAPAGDFVHQISGSVYKFFGPRAVVAQGGNLWVDCGF